MDIFLMICFFVVCILLILIVLLQKGRGGGLGSAFGGGGGSSAFGTRTGDVFTWVTIVLTGLFLLLAILMVLAVKSNVQTVPVKKVVLTPAEWPQDHIRKDRIKVTMKCKTKGASIYYTTDGSEPTKKSKKYSKTRIPVTAGMVLKVKAFSPGKAASETVTKTYNKPEKKIAPPKPAAPSTTPQVDNPATPARAPATPAAAPAAAPAN